MDVCNKKKLIFIFKQLQPDWFGACLASFTKLVQNLVKLVSKNVLFWRSWLKSCSAGLCRCRTQWR